MSQVSYPIVFTIIFLGLIFPQNRKQSIHQQQSTYYKTKVAPVSYTHLTLPTNREV